MNVAIVIATHGEQAWADLAWSRAYPSTVNQGATEVIVEHYDNATLAQARNAAASKASAEWLCFLDADDELVPGYIGAFAAEPPEQVWIGNYTMQLVPALPRFLMVPSVEYQHPDGRRDKPRIPNQHRPFDEVSHAVIGTLVPKRLFDLVGGFQEHSVYEDWALWLACLRAGGALLYVPRAVYRAHVRPDGRNAIEERERRAEATRVYDLIRADHLARVDR